MALDIKHLQLQYMLCMRDLEIADLKSTILVQQMRDLSGASKDATFNPGPMTFTEPPPAMEPPAPTPRKRR